MSRFSSADRELMAGHVSRHIILIQIFRVSKVHDLVPFKSLAQNPMGSPWFSEEDEEEFVAWITAIGLPQHAGDVILPGITTISTMIMMTLLEDGRVQNSVH